MLQLQAIHNLTDQNATLRSMLERMCAVMNQLILKSDTVFIVMDEIGALPDKMKVAVMEMISLQQQEFEMETDLNQSSKHATTAKVHEETVKEKLATDNGKLSASCFLEGANLRRDGNEMDT